jgi:hypothetical protein
LSCSAASVGMEVLPPASTTRDSSAKHPAMDTPRLHGPYKVPPVSTWRAMVLAAAMSPRHVVALRMNTSTGRFTCPAY